jgi:hypothetical protein
LICVNDTLRVAYVVIPKAASSAIRAAVQGRHAEQIPEGYFSFTFVRHPWDRLVSALYTVFRSQAPLDERLAQFIENPNIPIDSHARPQVEHLAGHRIDFIGYYHEIERDWSALQHVFGLPDLQHVNRGKYRPARWQDAPITWERWRPRYEQDLALCPDWH